VISPIYAACKKRIRCISEIGQPHIVMNPFALMKRARLAREEDAIEYADMEEIKQSKRRLARKERGAYTRSLWLRYIDVAEDDPLNDPDSHDAKVFKNRFRVTWWLFKNLLLPWTKEQFPEKPDAVGRMAMPVGLKLLGVLRILGRALHFDDIAEYIDTGFKGEVLRVFFTEWVRRFSDCFYEEWIHPPSTDAEIAVARKPFEDAGIPGALGSVDGVHTRWDRCTQSNLNRHKGKEGFPTLGFQVVVLHTTWIVSVTKAFAGSYNDKTITRYDDFVQSIRRRERYAENEFQTFALDGSITTRKGLFLICDNGYHRWRILQHPSKISSTEGELLWSEMMESLRKDVESTFGTLKARFLILKYGFRFHRAEVCQNVMFVCCILHNMLLRNMGLDIWDEIDYEVEDVEAARDREALERIYGSADLDYSFIGPTNMLQQDTDEAAPTADYLELRAALIEHFEYKLARHEVHWPRRLKAS
jgi:hypothetical protein